MQAACAAAVQGRLHGAPHASSGGTMPMPDAAERLSAVTARLVSAGKPPGARDTCELDRIIHEHMTESAT